MTIKKEYSKMYQCKWCKCSSKEIGYFEEDFKNHKGFWCPECDGFTYFNQEEMKQINRLILESSISGETIVQEKGTYNKRLSPLRYPGGKSKLISYIANQLDPSKRIFVEPFCGGASVGLSLLDKGLVDKLVLNDLENGIYSLFLVIKEYPNALIEKIRNYHPNKEDYFRFQKSILQQLEPQEKSKEFLIETAFRFLIVNRCSFSGIFKAHPTSNIVARFNPKELEKRINKIHSLSSNIEIYCVDAKEIIEEYYWQEATLFIDAPYYRKGKFLYNQWFTEKQHEEVADLLNLLCMSYPDCADILVTYDDEAFIKNLYPLSEQKTICRKFCIANGS